MSPPRKTTLPSGPLPLIPDKYLDVPSQRLYYLSLGLLCQAIKLVDFTLSLASRDDGLATCKKWLLVDFLYCTILIWLRIPRLQYSKAVVLLQIGLLWFLDGIMFGGITLNISGGTADLGIMPSSFSSKLDLSATPETFSFADVLVPLGLGWLTSSSGAKDAHLLGQHTVRMSPISTAELNNLGLSFCLAPPDNFVLIPILLNNTNLHGLKYSLTPLGHEGIGSSKVEYDLTAKDLKAIEQTRLEGMKSPRPSATTARDSEEYDEYDDGDRHEPRNSHPSLQSTQTLVHIRLNKPGTLRLERVFDASNVDARLIYPSSVTVVPCPRVEFVDDDFPKEDIRCSGEESNLQLTINIYGIPPLSLRWLRTVNGRREHFLVEGIEDRSEDSNTRGEKSPSLARPGKGVVAMIPQELRIPLAISLDIPGTYVYALEEIVDGIGNVVRIGAGGLSVNTSSDIQTKTTRSLVVLRRPTASFKHCKPGSPTSLLVGSEAMLVIATSEVNDLDLPLELLLQYQPLIDVGDDPKGNKLIKPWKKTFTTQGIQNELGVHATAPGDYTIVGVRGKWCTGDVLAPETCRVVEKPFPTAEIEWKRIHECSGDTGVSASLVLHGTPPFHVQYHMQRGNEAPVQFFKTFANARGGLTLQPERSGHYFFTFVQLSDANYKKIELKGPSIDQLIHPPAAADFVTGHAGKKRTINSCDGGTVEVEVDLRGTSPWNLELQIVGPRSTENLKIEGIEDSRKLLQISVPKAVDIDGGSFEINIVNVEDVYKCKRSISVPGILVNVRRVKSTVKFYGSRSKRQLTVLQDETASLPLRLTGDGPWRVKYRRLGESKTITQYVNSPNDYLRVSQKGTYEIVDVADSQCPGSVITESAIFTVDWVPRPSAKLSPQTNAVYEAYNGSYILPTVCEGVNDFVDLDLTGRPPFQIMYNIAQDGESGGTKLLDQPTFNSIQPRTRFQLQTSNPGRMYYEVKQIGDTAYPLGKYPNTIIPRAERLLFEQQISMRPSARFKNRNRMSYCLNDSFTPLATSTDGIILFDGTPPFMLKLSIKNLAASHVDTTTVKVSTLTWKLDLPAYHFTSIGPHLISIDSVRDSSNCTPATLDPLGSSIWVDVAETAAIVPFDRREHFCVGEVSQFQLEGIPPWTIGYRINGRTYTQEAKVSPFALVQKQPGEFTITSIAHQQKLCKAAVTDLRFTVHSLPSAQVGHGKRVYQDIHEGDQAEIVFNLVGEPPFTFTYQRSEPSSRKGGKPGKVLETHTVSRVATNEYSVYSALEGTWTVTSISDRYCRYPSAQPDLGAGKKR
ncbi:hypothetical protein BDZ94DRAFT_1206742 [Collybia nuda]|uniref:Nucleoporin Pom152 n=1 Tax=Collybia nuda TaxID=64659 RepID=A0A9P5YH78_9AGAR|nr:hypothetical protein BDZ94DRAFT_1206742 [Collybia nuda]